MENNKKPKYIFFGTPEFAAIVLKKLIQSGFPPAYLICNPDKPTGRKKTITPPPTKIVAEENGIPVLQPEQLDPNDFKKLGSFDFFVIAAYSKIIKKEIIEIPRLGIIGVHPSLLPKYRGASPIQSSILEGDKETGVTLFLIDEKVDHGLIMTSSKLKTENLKLNYLEMQRKLAELGGQLLVQTLPKFAEGKIKSRPQDENGATFTKKFTSEDGYITPTDLEEACSGAHPARAGWIERKIRALNPEPGVWTIFYEKRTKLLEADLRSAKLILKTIQAEGKKPTSPSPK